MAGVLFRMGFLFLWGMGMFGSFLFWPLTKYQATAMKALALLSFFGGVAYFIWQDRPTIRSRGGKKKRRSVDTG